MRRVLAHSLPAIAAVSAVALYALGYVLLDGLAFPLRKDELHFWPTVLRFSESFPPAWQTFLSYNELNTPLPFAVFGAIEHFLAQGVWLGRLLNWFLSLTIVLAILFAAGRATWQSIGCAVALVAYPYYLGTSAHLYTDIFTAFFCVGGVAVAFRTQSRSQAIGSALWLSAAVCCRQYAVVIPLALLLSSPRRWWVQLLPIAVLASWFIVWGGPAPAVALASQLVETSRLSGWLPHNSLYFLSCVGLYYVLPELLLFAESRRGFLARLQPNKWPVGLGVGLAILFLLFPPWGNEPSYPFPEMGFFDKALRFALPDGGRLLVFYGFAWLTLVRFVSVSLPSLMVFLNAMLMAKAHIAWDKYALPLLAVLWWWRAAEANQKRS